MACCCRGVAGAPAGGSVAPRHPTSGSMLSWKGMTTSGTVPSRASPYPTFTTRAADAAPKLRSMSPDVLRARVSHTLDRSRTRWDGDTGF